MATAQCGVRREMGLRKDIFLLSVLSMKIIKKSPDLPWKKRNPVQPEGGAEPTLAPGEGRCPALQTRLHTQPGIDSSGLVTVAGGGRMDGWME